MRMLSNLLDRVREEKAWRRDWSFRRWSSRSSKFVPIPPADDELHRLSRCRTREPVAGVHPAWLHRRPGVLDGFDFEATSFALPLVIREFHITPTQAGAIGSVTNIGLLLGALVFGPISDRFGRRPLFQWALFTYAFGTFLSAIAPNYTFLLAAHLASPASACPRNSRSRSLCWPSSHRSVCATSSWEEGAA